MRSYEGLCIGGPLDGKRMAHSTKKKHFFRPLVGGYPVTENSPVIAVEIGTYHLNDFKQWHWWPSKEGKAMDTLMGKATA